MSGAKDFEKVYLHLSRDHSAGRRLHELHCFQRWFILRDYMRAHSPAGEAGTFFGDGDTALFANVTLAWKGSAQRRSCDATTATPGTALAFNWVSTGCSSLWTLLAIESFCAFLLETYQESKYTQTLRTKAAAGSSVVDMSLLWLWYVRAMPDTASGFQTGRPWRSLNPRMSAEAFRAAYDSAFKYSKGLLRQLPPREPVGPGPGTGRVGAAVRPLRVCNGLDVAQRTVLDHMRGWSDGTAPALPLPDAKKGKHMQDFGPAELGCTYGCPSVTASALRSGGIPESVDSKEAELLSKQRLFLLTLHYQGESKAYMTYDICRTLHATGPRREGIRDTVVVNICAKSLSSGLMRNASSATAADDDWPCMPHLLYGQGHGSQAHGTATVCF